MRDFTLNKYSQLLKAPQDGGFFFISFEQYIQASKERIVILRHDIDKMPFNSLKTAEIEYELGIKGAYYFRVVPGSYDEKIIKQIVDLGHEVGYQYENLSGTLKDEGRTINPGKMKDLKTMNDDHASRRTSRRRMKLGNVE